MKPIKKIRVMLADDHTIVRNGLFAIINMQPDMRVVCEAATGREAVARFFEYLPDVLLLDLRMPELDGAEVIETVRAREANARVLILTTYQGDENIYRCLRAGAKGYLLKEVSWKELVAAIRAVHQGEQVIPSSIAARIAEHISSPGLTTREVEVLQLVARGMSNKDIASALAITERTVKVHLGNLFNKLQVNSRTEAVTAGLKRGIVHLEV
jgi:two-component system, NarL family, response regulator